MIVKWNKQLEVGVSDIDMQHRRLIEIAAKANDILQDELKFDKYDDIVDIIKELAIYAKYHFDYEEKCMMERGYKKIFTHKMEHNKFMETVNSLNLNLSEVDEDQDSYLSEILRFIVDWTISHILEKDREVFVE